MSRDETIITKETPFVSIQFYVNLLDFSFLEVSNLMKKTT